MKHLSPILFALILVVTGCGKRENAGPESQRVPEEKIYANSSRVVETELPGKYSRSFAVLIGIDNYKDCSKNLGCSKNDVRELERVLIRDLGYDRGDIRCLTDKDATLANIKKSLTTWLNAKNPKPTDSFLLYFSGHGELAGDLGAVICPADTNFDDLKSKSLPLKWIVENLSKDKIACNHRLLLLDCCFSGSVFSLVPRGETVANKPVKLLRNEEGVKIQTVDVLQNYLDQPVFYGITAGQKEKVFENSTINKLVIGEGEKRHSIFTEMLIEILRERANSSRKDHAFFARQLAAQIQERVRNDSNGLQIPDSGFLEKGDGDFVFFESRSRKTPNELASRVDYFHRLVQSHAEFTKENSAISRRLLAECDSSDRCWVWSYFSRMARGDKSHLESSNPRVVSDRDGKYFLLTDENGFASLWDCRTNQQVSQIPKRFAKGTQFAICKQGPCIFTGTTNGVIQCWNCSHADATPIWKRKLPRNELTVLQLSPDQEYLGIGISGTIHVLRPDSGDDCFEPFRNERPVGTVVDIAFDPNSKKLGAVVESFLLFQASYIAIWDLHDQSLLKSMESSERDFGAIEFLQDDFVAVSYEKDHERLDTPHAGIAIANLYEDEVHFFNGNSKKAAKDFALNSEASRLVAIGDELQFWDVSVPDQACPIVTLKIQGDFCRFLETEQLLVSGENSSSLLSIVQSNQLTHLATSTACTSAFIDEDSFVVGHSTGELSIWNSANMDRVAHIALHDEAIRCIAVSKSGELVATVSDDNTTAIYNIFERKAIRRFRLQPWIEDDFYPQCIAFSENGEHVFIPVSKTVVVGELPTGLIHELQGHTDTIRSIGAPQGSEIVSVADDGKLRIWDFEKKECKKTVDLEFCPLVCGFSNRWLVGDADGVVHKVDQNGDVTPIYSYEHAAVKNIFTDVQSQLPLVVFQNGNIERISPTVQENTSLNVKCEGLADVQQDIRNGRLIFTDVYGVRICDALGESQLIRFPKN